jgi:hypothetical protein
MGAVIAWLSPLDRQHDDQIALQRSVWQRQCPVGPPNACLKRTIHLQV